MRTNQTKTPAAISTIGIDLGKTTFHLIGLDKRGAIVLQQKVSRGQLERRLANVPRCLIGMEVCSGAHYIGRQLEGLGHDVRLIPAQYVEAVPQGAQERLPGCGGDCRGGAAADHAFRAHQDAGGDGPVGAA